jgi:hypothetical protein
MADSLWHKTAIRIQEEASEMMSSLKKTPVQPLAAMNLPLAGRPDYRL